MYALAQINSKLETNADKVSKRLFEGVPHIVISGAKHMIADSVMNRVLYRGEDVRALADTLASEDAYIPAPAEHPMISGTYVSATDPRADIQHGVGAFHFNWRMEGDRLVSDTAINPAKAYSTNRGIEILDRIEQQKPLDMSTGFYLLKNEEQGIGADGVEYDYVASELLMDHSALLPESVGAKSSDEGVGLFANTREQAQCELQVNALSDAQTFAPAPIEINQGILERINRFMHSLVSTNSQTTQSENEEPTVELKELTEQVNALQKTVESLQANQAEALAKVVGEALAPVSAKIETLEANADQAKQAEKDALVAKVTANKLLSEETAKTLDVNALSELAATIKPEADKPAFGLAGGFQVNSGEADTWADYDLNKGA